MIHACPAIKVKLKQEKNKNYVTDEKKKKRLGKKKQVSPLKTPSSPPPPLFRAHFAGIIKKIFGSQDFSLSLDTVPQSHRKTFDRKEKKKYIHEGKNRTLITTQRTRHFAEEGQLQVPCLQSPSPSMDHRWQYQQVWVLDERTNPQAKSPSLRHPECESPSPG